MSAFEQYVKDSLVRSRIRRPAIGGMLSVRGRHLGYHVADAVLHIAIAFGLAHYSRQDVRSYWRPTKQAVRIRYDYFGQAPGEGRLARSLRSRG